MQKVDVIAKDLLKLDVVSVGVVAVPGSSKLWTDVSAVVGVTVLTSFAPEWLTEVVLVGVWLDSTACEHRFGPVKVVVVFWIIPLRVGVIEVFAFPVFNVGLLSVDLDHGIPELMLT